MKKIIFTCLALSCSFGIATAQEDPTHVAIIPFVPTTRNAAPVAKNIETAVASCFIKERFTLLDRSVTAKLKEELEAAKNSASIYSKVVAEQGRLATAEYIVTGTVDSIVFEGVSSKDVLSGGVKNALDAKAKYSRFHGSVQFTIEISKVESGKVIFTKPYLIHSHDFDDASQADVVDYLMCRLTNEIQMDIRKIVPPIMIIVKVEKTKSDGSPDEVIINGGTEVFDDGKQKTACTGDGDISLASKTSAITSVFKKAKNAISSNKILLDVYDNQEILVSGKPKEHDVIIGELRVESNDAELSTCTVLKGGKEIKSYLDANKPILVKIQGNN